MVNKAHAPHFAADCFQHARAEIVSIAKRYKARKELAGRILQSDKNRKKDPLVPLIARKQQSGQFIQALKPRDFVTVQFDLSA